MSIHGYLQMEFIFWKYRGVIKCCHAESNMMWAESCLVDFAPCFRWNQVGSQLWFLCCGSPGTIALNTSFCHIWQLTDIMSVISLLLNVELWWVRSPVPTLPSMFGRAPYPVSDQNINFQSVFISLTKPCPFSWDWSSFLWYVWSATWNQMMLFRVLSFLFFLNLQFNTVKHCRRKTVP